MKKSIITLVVVAVAFSILYISFKRDFDQFNPLYSDKTVYVVVDQPTKTEKMRDITRYRYNVTGYTKEGKKADVTFASGDVLEPNTYIEVVAKGSYTRKWTKLKENEVPDQAFEALHAK